MQFLLWSNTSAIHLKTAFPSQLKGRHNSIFQSKACEGVQTSFDAAPGPWQIVCCGLLVLRQIPDVISVPANGDSPFESFRKKKPRRGGGGATIGLTFLSTYTPLHFFFFQKGTIIFLCVQTFHSLILVVWRRAAPLSAASTLALGHRWRSASPARWEGWVPGSWGCAVAPGTGGPPVRPESPAACLDPRRYPPASATAPSATLYAPGRGDKSHRVNMVDVLADDHLRPSCWHKTKTAVLSSCSLIKYLFQKTTHPDSHVVLDWLLMPLLHQESWR